MLIAGFPAGQLAANCYVLARDDDTECVVVDPGQAAAGPLNRVLAEHRLRPVAVLLTHGHLDHVASAREVCAHARIPAFVHAADEYMLTDPLAALSPELRAGVTALLQPGDDLTALRPDEVALLGPDAPGASIDGDGVITLDMAGLPIVVHFTPGHTGGSVTYRLPSDGERPDVLFTGDTLFAGSIGRTDLPGGSSPLILSSIAEQLLTRPDTTIVLPGHGPASTIGEERAGNPFLVGLG